MTAADGSEDFLDRSFIEHIKFLLFEVSSILKE